MTEYRLLPWAEAVATHGPVWRTIVEEKGLNPTLLPEWTGIIVESLTDPATVRVLVGLDGPRLLGVLPFHIRRDRINRIPVRILEPISSVVSYHAELVTRGNPAELLQALLRIHDQPPWDLVRLTGILAASPTDQAILEVARRQGLSLIQWPGEQSPYFRLATTGEKLLAAQSKTNRYQIRKHGRDIAAMPGVVTRWYGKDSDHDELLAAILHVDEVSWKQAAGVAIGSNARETEYYRRLLPWLVATDQLMASVLAFNDVPVAYSLCYVWQGTYGAMKGSFHEDFRRLAVGRYIEEQLIMRAADAGGLEWDFLGNAEPYKLAWSRDLRQHNDYFLYAARGRGRWLGLLKRAWNWLRPPHAAGK